jgi:tetratricopeptide (TPR) repeat protein
MAHDLQGLTITGTAASASALDAAVTAYYAWKDDPIGTLSAATAADPSFALGHAATASLYLLNGFRGDNPAVVGELAKAEAAIAGATERERLHLAAANAWADGAIVAATETWERILVDHPRDALALRFAHDTYFYLGHSLSLRDSVARVLPQWDRGNPHYGYVLGQYAFGLEEAGDLAQAEAVARQALSINPRDCWATHALTHVLEMASRQEEGIRFLESTLADWLQGKWLAVHNSWHLALFLIELGRGAEVLAKYDTFIAPKIGDDALLDLVDAAALLWRLEIAGVDVGSRWQAISDQWLQHADDHVLVFNDLHIALAASRAGNADGLARLLASLDAYILDGQGDNAEISADVGRRLMRGVAAFGTGDYARAVELLLPVRYKWIRIGGSHAQRDLLIQTVIEAARRSGQAALARALLNERLAWRPTPRSRRLLAQAA